MSVWIFRWRRNWRGVILCFFLHHTWGRLSLITSSFTEKLSYGALYVASEGFKQSHFKAFFVQNRPGEEEVWITGAVLVLWGAGIKSHLLCLWKKLKPNRSSVSRNDQLLWPTRRHLWIFKHSQQSIFGLCNCQLNHPEYGSLILALDSRAVFSLTLSSVLQPASLSKPPHYPRSLVWGGHLSYRYVHWLKHTLECCWISVSEFFSFILFLKLTLWWVCFCRRGATRIFFGSDGFLDPENLDLSIGKSAQIRHKAYRSKHEALTQ